MHKKSRILITGSTGFVGRNLFNKLKKDGYKNIYGVNRNKYNLLYQTNVFSLFEEVRPEFVYICSAKVGGILENQKMCADMIYENTLMQTILIKACKHFKVNKMVFLGSSCIYPSNFDRPISEKDFLAGKLEETNIGYSLAKINGIKMCQLFNKQYGCNFISVMPCNLYGHGDRYDLNKGHVLASLIIKIYEAKIKQYSKIELWGDGTPKREFIFIDDLADALIFLMNKYDSPEIINVGTGIDCTINELALKIMKVINYKCKIVYDKNKPNGTMRKVLDVSKINKLGWRAKTGLMDGLKKTIDNYIEHYHKGNAMRNFD